MASVSQSAPSEARLELDKIGFIGLGNMGAPMSINLAKWLKKNDYPALTVFSRSSTSLDGVPESSHHVKHAKSMKEVVMNCEIVFTSFSSDTVVVSVYKELFEYAREKDQAREKDDKSILIFSELSTIYPRHSGDLERESTKINRTYYLQTPIFGPPTVAQERNLLFVLSGDYYAKQKVKALVVPSMARKTIDVGSNVERAAAFKLSGNMITLSLIETLAETLLFAEQVGVGSALLMEFVKEFLPAPDMIEYGTKIQTNSFEGDTGFTVEGGLKDANHIRHLAAECGATVPIVDIAHRNLITSRANGGGLLDWSSLVAGPRLAAGVQPFTGLKATPKDTGFGSMTDDSDSVERPVADGDIKEVKNF